MSVYRTIGPLVIIGNHVFMEIFEDNFISIWSKNDTLDRKKEKGSFINISHHDEC